MTHANWFQFKEIIMNKIPAESMYNWLLWFLDNLLKYGVLPKQYFSNLFNEVLDFRNETSSSKFLWVQIKMSQKMFNIEKSGIYDTQINDCKS